jgi:hypothetical protein
MVRQIKGIYIEGKPANVLASYASDSGSTVEITSSSSSSPQQYQDRSLYYSSSTNDTDEGGNDDADGSPIVSLGSTSSNLPPLNSSPFRATDVTFESPETSLSVPPGMPTLNSPSTATTLFNSDQDTWTKRDLSRSYVRNLVESVLAWDGLPLCICHQELFLAEFDSGARTYCSPTLVNALLALAVTRMEAQQKCQGVLGGRSGGTLSLGGSDFLREALETCALSQGRGAILDNLPNTQAIGVLAIYQVCSGQDDDEARKLVNEYKTAMADLCLSTLSPAQKSGVFKQVCVDTFHGAVALQR